jgi:ribonuclease-3
MPEHPVEAILQYQFSNHDLLYEALLAAGASKSAKNIEGNKQGNKRLALLGDSVLREAILEPWYQTEESIGKCICLRRIGKTDLGRGRIRKSKRPRQKQKAE